MYFIKLTIIPEFGTNLSSLSPCYLNCWLCLSATVTHGLFYQYILIWHGPYFITWLVSSWYINDSVLSFSEFTNVNPVYLTSSVCRLKSQHVMQLPHLFDAKQQPLLSLSLLSLSLSSSSLSLFDVWQTLAWLPMNYPASCSKYSFYYSFCEYLSYRKCH